MVRTSDVVVVGAGVIGLACAWRLAQDGAQVALLDDGGPAASDVAAGMLAPVTESSIAEPEMLRLGIAALRRFPSFVDALEAAGAAPVGLRREGTLALGLTPDDESALDHLVRTRERLGLAAERLARTALRAAEPFLSARVRGAVLVSDDLSVDPRRLVQALRDTVSRLGVEILREPATSLVVRGGRAAGVRLASGEELTSASVVLAGGARSPLLAGVPDDARPPVTPVQGHVLRLRPLPGAPPTTLLDHTVRAMVRGRDVYLVPRTDGELVVGATVERRGYDTTVSVAAVRKLLRSAYEVLPVVDDLALAEIGVGLRPGTPDNGPVVGWSSLPGLLVACGHYRNGVLLSALTADEVARLVAGEPPGPEWEPFRPSRFAPIPRTVEESA